MKNQWWIVVGLFALSVIVNVSLHGWVDGFWTNKYSLSQAFFSGWLWCMAYNGLGRTTQTPSPKEPR